MQIGNKSTRIRHIKALYERKPLWRANFSFIYMVCDLSVAILSYKLVNIRLAKLKNSLSLLKVNTFKTHGQHKA